jgi:hypothetical protein
MRWGWTIWQGTVAHMQQGVNKRSKEKGRGRNGYYDEAQRHTGRIEVR